MKHWIIGGLLVLFVGIGLTGAVAGNNGWGPNNDNVVTRSVAADGTETIIIHEQNNRHFFPFGLFIFPLGIFFCLFLARTFAFRGRWEGGGSWMRGTVHASSAPGWFDEWHNLAHGTAPPVAEKPVDETA